MVILTRASLVVSVGALIWMVHHVGIAPLRDGLSQVGWAFAAMWLAYLASTMANAMTLHYCAGKKGDRVRFAVYLRATLAGLAVNEATPLGKLGEVTKYGLLGERMPAARAASALIIHNFVTFIVSCLLITASPVVALVWFDVSPGLRLALFLTAGLFAVLGVGASLLFWYGVGAAPFRVLRRLHLPRKRVDGWEKKWRKVASEWRDATHHMPSMKRAFVVHLASRVIGLVEPWIALSLLGVPHAVAAAWLVSANYQVVAWATSFVPMQAGTAEAGAYGLFEGLGLSGAVGVLFELLRKLRRVTFIVLGIGLLGWSNFRGLAGRQRSPSRANSASDAASAPSLTP